MTGNFIGFGLSLWLSGIDSIGTHPSRIPYRNMVHNFPEGWVLSGELFVKCTFEHIKKLQLQFMIFRIQNKRSESPMIFGNLFF